MTIGSLKSLPDKWQAGIAFGRAPAWQKQNYCFIHAWFLSLKSLPKTGEMLTPKNYRGIRFFKKFTPSNA